MNWDVWDVAYQGIQHNVMLQGDARDKSLQLINGRYHWVTTGIGESHMVFQVSLTLKHSHLQTGSVVSKLIFKRYSKKYLIKCQSSRPLASAILFGKSSAWLTDLIRESGRLLASSIKPSARLIYRETSGPFNSFSPCLVPSTVLFFFCPGAVNIYQIFSESVIHGNRFRQLISLNSNNDKVHLRWFS